MTQAMPDPKPKTKKAARARQDILNVAARMMSQQGYTEMSLRDLAMVVGMKPGSLYYHFPSKDALVTEVMRLGVEMVQQSVQEALEGQDALPSRERLTIAMAVHLETLLSASDFSSAHIRCYPFVPEAVQAELKTVRKDYDQVWYGLIAAFLGKDAHSVEVRHLHHILLGAMNWSLEWFDPERDSVADYSASLAQMLP